MRILENNIDEIIHLCEKYHVKNMYAFGSILRDDFDEDSDIDLLVSFEPIDINSYADNYFNLKFSLQHLLKRPIDLLEEQSVRNPYFKETVDRQKKIVYGY